ncbi:hypothetical protein AWW68_07945 [Roseivirga spongicola]|uniref:histidine kinase n=1 Tax=Roseivirga spongicola TaxID=333140 RepID=A0A150XAJ8_9BACT|nr:MULTISPECIES: ATP-binding protein [Roseivirga]KYG75759.1 hypothetical protein AWW68_07945 [Roseivirga spongicola]MBO6497355.1 response regulator [Roseivirga sp.]MBO6662526.1 response regulator [Roseivirga sp.]MBO6761296.1 response regulator [Roseivirga sp.]MBO6909911.1 response regulator [Roseivirga sp.]
MTYALIFAGALIIFLAVLLFIERNRKNRLEQENEIITKRKDSLRQSWELLMGHSSDFYFRYNKNGEVHYTSSNVERLLGYKKEGGPLHFRQFITENPVNQNLYHHIEKLFNLEFDELKPYFLEIKDGNGETHMLEVYETPQLDSEGNVDYINGIARDLTSVYKAQQELKESERQQLLVLDSIPDPMFTINRDLCYSDYQVVKEDDLWFKPSEFIGKRVKDVVPEQKGIYFEEAIQKTFESGQVQTLEYDFGEGDEQEFFEGRIIKLDEERVLVISRDITPQKKLERELRKAKSAAESAAQAKSNFLATMSHEIRTPMNGVVGMISLLAETDLNEEQKEFVETIQSSSDTLLRIINDILDYSRIESGKLAFEESLFYLKKVIDDSIGLIKFEAQRKGILMNAVVDEDVPNFIRTDRGRLRQVLLNLLSNAVKFTEHGSIVLRVSVERLTDKNVNLLFKIKDTGIGIPKDKLQGLFREFTQVDSSHTRKFGGTGLGLAIVKKLVKMLNGKISVESEVGVGSVFTFSIRAKLASKMPAKPEDQAEEEAQQDFIGEDYPMRVLMAEDNSVNRKLTTLFLERMGYVPEVVSDGLDVIKKLKTKTFDVILLDIAMPQMDGYEVLKLVRQMDLENQPRVIGVSANAFKGDIEKGMSLGLDDYLVKPLRFNELKEKLIASYKTIHNSKP